MSVYNRRFIIVARADLAAAANLAAAAADWDPDGGSQTFTVGLSASGSAPATAFWCNTALTPSQALAVRNRLQARGATNAEITPIAIGQTPASNRFAVFDGDLWTPDAVLTACGLQTLGRTP